MKSLSLWAFGALVISVLAACAAAVSMAPGGPGTTRQTGLGEVFTDAEGMTLYTYDADKPGESNCTGICAVIWPPVIAAGLAHRTDVDEIENAGIELDKLLMGRANVGHDDDAAAV